MVARNDPEFFHRAVKDLTIGKFELEHFPQQGINFDDCMTVILTTCTGVERFSILTATTFRLKWKHMQPKYVFFVVGNDAESFPLLYNLLSPSLTHLHLDFASPDGLSIYKSIVAVSVFKQSPGLSHLQLSGGAFESLEPQKFRQAIDPIVSILPQTLTRLIIHAISLRAWDLNHLINPIATMLVQAFTRLMVSAMPSRVHTDSTRIPVQLKVFQSDPRVVFILPMNHPLNAVEELQSHEESRDAYLTRADIHCEEFCARYLDVVSA